MAENIEATAADIPEYMMTMIFRSACRKVESKINHTTQCANCLMNILPQTNISTTINPFKCCIHKDDAIIGERHCHNCDNMKLMDSETTVSTRQVTETKRTHIPTYMRKVIFGNKNGINRATRGKVTTAIPEYMRNIIEKQDSKKIEIPEYMRKVIENNQRAMVKGSIVNTICNQGANNSPCVTENLLKIMSTNLHRNSGEKYKGKDCKHNKMSPGKAYVSFETLVHDIGETLYLGKKTKQTGFLPDSMENFIKICEIILQKLQECLKESQRKSDNLELLQILGYNIDILIECIRECRDKDMISPSVEHFLNTCEDIRGKLYCYRIYSYASSIAAILGSGSSLVSKNKSRDSDFLSPLAISLSCKSYQPSDIPVIPPPCKTCQKYVFPPPYKTCQKSLVGVCDSCQSMSSSLSSTALSICKICQTKTITPPTVHSLPLMCKTCTEIMTGPTDVKTSRSVCETGQQPKSETKPSIVPIIEEVDNPCVTCYQQTSPNPSCQSHKIDAKNCKHLKSCECPPGEKQISPLTKNPEEKIQSASEKPCFDSCHDRANLVPSRNKIGYFEKSVKKIVKINRYKDVEGNIKEDKTTINIRRQLYDPTKGEMVDKTDYELDIEGDADIQTSAPCDAVPKSGDVKMIRFTKSEVTVRVSQPSEPVLKQSLSEEPLCTKSNECELCNYDLADVI